MGLGPQEACSSRSSIPTGSIPYTQNQEFPRMESLLADLRHSLRLLRQSPSFTITAVGALAIGIGATTGIFTLIHSIMLKVPTGRRALAALPNWR